MKLDGLRLVTPLRIRLVPLRLAPTWKTLAKGDEIKLRDDDGTVVLVAAGDAWDVVATDRSSQQELAGLLRRGQPTLAWIAKAPTGDRTELQVDLIETTHALDHRDPNGWVLGFDTKIRDDLWKRVRLQAEPLQNDAAALVAWLHDQLVIAGTRLHPGPRLLVSASPTKPSADAMKAGSFRIWGSSLAVDVRWSAREDGGSYLITRVVHGSRLGPTERRPIWVVVGDLVVTDEAAALSRKLAALDVVDGADAGYLGLWQEYQAIEKDLALDRAATIGSMSYVRCSKRGSSWHFHVPDGDVLDRLGGQRDIELEARDASTIGHDLRPFCGTLDLQASTGGGPDRHAQLVLRTQDGERDPPPAGQLRVSLRGQQANWKRRQAAYQRIRATAETGVPLAAILEGRAIPSMQGRRVDPLSPAVRAIFGPNGPTSTQRLALDVALNTPDIALIQGPPGTGKTQVIRALALRLSELGGGEEVRGELLVSSFQHEAVQHVAGAIRILGLPAVKLGSRRDREAANSHVDEWRLKQMNLLAQRPVAEPRPVYRVLETARAQLAAALRGFEPAVLARNVARVVDEASAWLTPELLETGRTLDQELARIGEQEARPRPKRDQLRRIAFGLRIAGGSHADDGPQRLTAVLGLARTGQVWLAEEDIATLDSVRLEERPSDAMLTQVSEVRDRLLDSLAETVVAVPAKGPRDDVARWLRDVIACLHEVARSSPEDAASIAADFRDALKDEREVVAAAIARYTSVLAATCVQSVAPAMVETVGLSNESLSFQTVVVDEAARANPLDLMIPMSLARRRIILVGDHRQLPHSLEPDVERAIDENPALQAKEALKLSLFEQLKERLSRNSPGGITRVVTLDRQYRMHPVLATFVSGAFYEAHGERFESGVAAGDRLHGLSELGPAVAAWIDLPRGSGSEMRQGASLARPCEAKLIAKRLGTWLAENPTLSFAVVTFYSAQVEALWAALEDEGLTDVAGHDGKTRVIHRDWRSLEDGRERLRVGTVDGFQGKEFDVVLLSQVRSNDRSIDETPSSWRRKWGFLLLENRMCVALSRQKRALVVVGDPTMIEGEIAARELGGLVRFRALCGGEHGRILGG